MSYTRFGIYYVPRPGDLASFGARWLGWDVETSIAALPLDVPGRDAVTAAPRKYGFHATLKPPFRLADGTDRPALERAVTELARTRAPVRGATLKLSRLGRFLALVPAEACAAIDDLAAACVTELDGFRAPAEPAELARRRGRGLSPEREENLRLWGYPHVLGAFRFHMTLTGPLAETELALWETRLAHLLPVLPAPVEIADLALVGERADGMFELVHRAPLGG